MKDELYKEVERMCSYSVGIREVSRAKGREEGRVQDIMNLMTSLSVTFEKAAESLRVPKEYYPRYKELLSIE